MPSLDPLTAPLLGPDAPVQSAGDLDGDAWTAPALPGLPPVGEVWLWKADLGPNVARERLCREWLSSEEQGRVAQARLLEVARRRLLARGFVRDVLGACLGVSPASLQIGRGPQGKPRLDGSDRSLRFNLSHSGDVAVLAVTAGSELGVDVERVRPSADVLRIAGRYLTVGDVASLEGLADEQRDREFFRRWTLREALLKAHGCGWLGSADHSREGLAGGEAAYEFQPACGYMGALVVLGELSSVRKHAWPPADGILDRAVLDYNDAAHR